MQNIMQLLARSNNRDINCLLAFYQVLNSKQSLLLLLLLTVVVVVLGVGVDVDVEFPTQSNVQPNRPTDCSASKTKGAVRS